MCFRCLVDRIGHFCILHIFVCYFILLSFQFVPFYRVLFMNNQQWCLVHSRKFKTCWKTLCSLSMLRTFKIHCMNFPMFNSYVCGTKQTKQVFTQKIRENKKTFFYAHLMHILLLPLFASFCSFLDSHIKMCAFFSHSSDLLMTCTKRISQQIERMHT